MRSATRALALAAVASATVLAAPPVVHPGIDSAWAAHCSNADALPTQISTTQARAAVVCC